MVFEKTLDPIDFHCTDEKRQNISVNNDRSLIFFPVRITVKDGSHLTNTATYLFLSHYYSNVHIIIIIK